MFINNSNNPDNLYKPDNPNNPPDNPDNPDNPDTNHNLYNLDKKVFKKPFRDTTLLFDDVSIYSSTPDTVSYIWINEFSKLLGPNLTVFDACACVGGDTIPFGRYFKSVIACEINKDRFGLLNKNIQLKYLKYKIKTFCLDFRVLIGCDDYITDIIFLDLPWGGRTYNRDNFKLSDIIIENNIEYDIPQQNGFEIVNNLISLKKYKYIILKLPINANETEFNYSFWRYFRKMKYGIIKVV